MKRPSSEIPIPGAGGKRRYWAFLSYSHRDKAWARKVHRQLETYRMPRRLVGKPTLFGWPAPRRLFPVFRDEDELPTSADLGDNLTEALEASHTLVVICSPHSGHSHWVNEEIRRYKEMGRESRIMALVIDGEPNASDQPESGRPECFPPALRRKVGPDGKMTDEPTEPLAADVRENQSPWRIAKLKLIAGIAGIPFDELRQREKERARVRACLWSLAGLCVLGSFVALRHHLEEKHREEKMTRKIASASRHIAEKHLLHAGRDLLEAADLGAGHEVLSPLLRLASAALVPQSDIMPSAAKTIESLAFSPDGRRLAAAGGDGRVSIWNLRNDGALLGPRLKMAGRSASQVVFHPLGDRVAVSLWDGTVRMWPYAGPAGPAVFSGHYPKVRLNAVDIDGSGRWMISGGDDTFAKIWDLGDGMLSGPAIAEHNDFLKSVRFSRDGSLVVTAGLDGSVKVFAFPSRRLIADIVVKDGINRALVAADNRTIIAGGRSGTIYLGDLAEKRIVRVIDRAHANRINDLALHPDGTSFFSVSDDGYARRWSIADGGLLQSIEDHGPLKDDPLAAPVKILAVACSPDGKAAATGADRGNVKLWALDREVPLDPPAVLSGLEERIRTAFGPEVE